MHNPAPVQENDMVAKGLLKGLEDFESWRPSGEQQQHYWKRPEYWEESWRLEEDLLSLNIQWKTLSLHWCENLLMSK